MIPGMDRARWLRLEQLCFEALELEPEARNRWLAEQCRNDPALFDDAKGLLHHLEGDPGFLETPIADLRGLWNSAAVDGTLPDEPTEVGAWQLVRRLAEGGMGSVWLASREFEGALQYAAVKLIRRGMDTEDTLVRFRQERRILGRLNHPNIARLLDAAATLDGRPYLVMEYVAGIPITEYCNQQYLGLGSRLQLFLIVCDAVQHAHQHLVIHRDLKPRNILVTDSGTVKLLDFGISKVLGGDESLGPLQTTRTQARVFTPEYAAPEQFKGGLITTATDVYGLGLLLFELLAGRHPLLDGGESISQIEAATLEQQPKSLAVGGKWSTGSASGAVDFRIPRELDLIVHKALHKEPERRYASVAAFADDIRRHLTGHPIKARPDTMGYRTSRFIRRNLAWTTAAATLALSLTAVTVVSLMQSRRVAAESAKVASERDKAVQVRGFLMEMFGATGAGKAAGDSITVRRLLDLQVKELDVQEWVPELKAEMLAVLADGYDRLGLWEEAEPLAARSLSMRRGILPASHPDLASSLSLTGWILHELGRSSEALSLLREAVAIRRSLGREGDSDLSRSLNDLGVVWNSLGAYDSAEATLKESLSIRERLFGRNHRSVGITANNLAGTYFYRSDLPSAVAMQQLALEALNNSVGREHQRTIVALSNLATMKLALGDMVGAERDFRELLLRQSELQGTDHPVTSQVRLSLAAVLIRSSKNKDDPRLVEGDALLRHALKVYRATLDPGHLQIGVTLTRLGELSLARDEPTAALAYAQQGVGILQKALGESHRTTAGALAGLARINRKLGALDVALETQQRAVAAYRSALGGRHPETARAEAALCELQSAANDPLKALESCDAAATDVAASLTEDETLLAMVQLRRAAANYRLGRMARADSIVALVAGNLDGTVPGGEVRRILDSLQTAAR